MTPVNNAVLFSFHTSNPLPYVDVEKAATTGNLAPIAIELVSNNAITPSANNVDANTLVQFLTPIANWIAPGSAATPGTVNVQITEPGMPFIDGNGLITGAQLFNTSSPVTIADIETLEKQMVLVPGQTLSQLLNKNTLSQQWDAGIIEYEQGKNSEAVQTLGAIQNAPAASVFIQTQLGRLNNLFNKFKQALQTRAPDSKSLDPQTQHPQRTSSYIQSSIILQPQQSAQIPKMQDDPAIQAALQRLWDKAGR